MFGPDDKLYVSLFNPNDRNLGFIIRYTQDLVYDGIFAFYDPNSFDCSKYLHRPEGLVFSPDGKLYVTSFIRVPNENNDVDKILVFDLEGNCIDSRVIDLWRFSEDRKFAQYLIFGPNDRLYVWNLLHCGSC